MGRAGVFPFGKHTWKGGKSSDNVPSANRQDKARECQYGLIVHLNEPRRRETSQVSETAARCFSYVFSWPHSCKRYTSANIHLLCTNPNSRYLHVYAIISCRGARLKARFGGEMGRGGGYWGLHTEVWS